jgi:uncharacterized membrane protein YGL010W
MLSRIQEQHKKDLTVYRQAHREWRNRCIHYLFIPIEYASFQVMLMSVCMGVLSTMYSPETSDMMLPAIANMIRGISWSVALLCLLVHSPYPRAIAIAAAIFHAFTGEWISRRMVFMEHHEHEQMSVHGEHVSAWWLTYGLYAVMYWSLAWVVQVCIGHYYLERNEPNIAKMSDVSYLSMILSVLISWSS